MAALAFEAGILLVQVVMFAAAAAFLFCLTSSVLSEYLDVPFVRTPRRYAPLVALALDLRPGDIVYELGSGDGAFLLACAALEREAHFVGIERNFLLHLRALLRRYRAGVDNVEFRRQNFFATDFSQAGKIYAYLLQPVMQRLQPKFESEFKGRLASRAFPFARREMANVVELSETVGRHGQHLLFVYDF